MRMNAGHPDNALSQTKPHSKQLLNWSTRGLSQATQRKYLRRVVKANTVWDTSVTTLYCQNNKKDKAQRILVNDRSHSSNIYSSVIIRYLKYQYFKKLTIDENTRRTMVMSLCWSQAPRLQFLQQHGGNTAAGTLGVGGGWGTLSCGRVWCLRTTRTTPAHCLY